ncbi:hypothetical protein [Dyella japonica]|uniref:Uncharacterized protein n=1 Tax=Dyella japonica DSM 16301 TaxID=1440762 RepID=A0A0G9H4I2_9GAMM|nr:hypothetical protein [Dyella japonica]KLD64488.1 hypothetical protein Y882_06980 [Dyella japonica DSM 16301]
MRAATDGVVRLSVSGDPERCHELVPLAMALLHRTQERARVGGLPQLSAQQRLDADAYAYVVIAGGINAVHIVAGSGPTIVEAVDVGAVDIPDFLSGVVQSGYIEKVPADPPTPAYTTLNQFHPTQSCADRFKLAPGFQHIQRLAVEPADALATDLKNPDDQSPKVYSQYTRLRPTMYSGSMRHLVQILMGFGKPRVVHGQAKSIYDRANLPGVKDTPPSAFDRTMAKDGLKITFDWHFSRSHGLSFGPDGMPWIVEISITQGVMAMPLPLRPKTTLQSFRDRLEKDGDLEAIDVLDHYGGFPTGESLPPATQIDAWVRAGRIVRLVEHGDMKPFYDHTSYSSQMGWAFNASGTEAHNTAWRYEDSGVQKGVHYMVPIQIGAVEQIKVAAGASELRAAFGKLTGDAYKDTLAAAQWKVDRLSEFQMKWATAALSRKTEEAFQYVDGLVLDPIATASAHLSKVSEGALWYPPKAQIENGTIIRFPEPALMLLVAHSMKPSVPNAPVPPKCDTTMHVFFAGDELKWVKFYRDNADADPGSKNNYEPCMYIGQWSEHDDGGRRQVPPMFYTNDLDDREELAPSTTDISVRGIDMGYCRIFASDDPINPSIGIARRVKRFLETTDTKTVNHPSLTTGIAVPFYDREAYYYAVQRAHSGTSHTVTRSYSYLTDPWYCGYKRNCPGYFGTYRDTYDGHGNFTGWVPVSLKDVNGYGPNEYRTANPDTPLYNPSDPCCDIADSGPWCHGGDNIDAMLYDIPEPPLPPTTIENVPASGSYNVMLVCSSQQGVIQTATVTGTSFNLWPLWTPDLQDGFSADQYIEETHNVAGTADSIRFGINLNTGLRIVGAPDWSGMETGFMAYIGVING